jgi:hypothetical protein
VIVSASSTDSGSTGPSNTTATGDLTLTPATPSAGRVRTMASPASAVVKDVVNASRRRLPSVSAAPVPTVSR